MGLNLQHASVVVTMDQPWNPAVLEQRIGRVHRLGQHRPVSVINYVTVRKADIEAKIKESPERALQIIAEAGQGRCARHQVQPGPEGPPDDLITPPLNR